MSDWQYVDRHRLTQIILERSNMTETQFSEAFVEAQRDWRDDEIKRLMDRIAYLENSVNISWELSVLSKESNETLAWSIKENDE